MEAPRARPNKGILIKLAVLVIAAGVGGILVLRGLDVRGLIDECLHFVRSAGPGVFFTSMAILPAVGFPLSPFSLSAGSIFGPSLGMPLVFVCVYVALAINVAITYALTRYALGPILARLIARWGYSLPVAGPGDYWQVSVLLRVTPGPPFVAQGIILALVGVPFGIYMMVSCVVSWTYATVFVVFGDAILQGKGKLALVGIALFVGLTVTVSLVRNRLSHRAAARLAAQKGLDGGV